MIDADDVLANPQGVLTKLCEALGIGWDAAMLRGSRGGGKPTAHGRRTGTATVEASTGFGPPETDPVELPDDAQRVADRCRPYYERLAEHRIAP